MATLNIGELTGFVGLNVDDLERNARRGERDIHSLSQAVLDAAEEIEKEKLRARLDVDATELERKIEAAQQRLQDLANATYDPQLDVDIASAEADIQELQNKLQDLHNQPSSVDVDADIAQAESQLQQLQNKLTDLTNQRDSFSVEAETEQARADLTRLEASLAALNRERVRIRIDTEGAEKFKQAKRDAQELASQAFGAAGAVAMIGAKAGAVYALVGALSAAAGAAALLPAVLGAAAAAIATLKIGFSGMGDAISAMSDADSAGGGAASGAGAAREAALQRVEAAQRSLADAQEAAERSAITGAQQISDAQEAVAEAMERADEVAKRGAKEVADARSALADAVEAAAGRVEMAESNLERSQITAKSAQEAVNRAREDAKEKLEDLALALSGAALDEEAANLRLLKAQDALKRAGTNKNSLGYKEAALAVKQAEQALAETKERYGDVQKEAADANAKGVDGADAVVAAQQRADDANKQVAASEKALEKARQEGADSVAKATQKVADAEAEAAKASVDATKDVEKAKQSLARTEQQVAWAQEDAAKRVADAERGVAEALKAVDDAAAGGGGGVDKYAEAMKKLSPAAQAVVRELQRLKPEWDAIKKSVQEKMFTGVAAEIGALAAIYLPQLKSMLEGIAVAFNRAFMDVSGLLKSKETADGLGLAFDNVRAAVSNFAQSIKPIVSILVDLFTVGSGFLPKMAQNFADAATNAAEFVHKAAESGKLKDWIQAGLDVLGQLWQILKNIGAIFATVFGGSQAEGSAFLAMIVEMTGALRTFLEQPAVQTAVQGLFAFLANAAPVLAPLALGLMGVSKAITGVTTAAAFVGKINNIGQMFGLWGNGADGALAKIGKFALQGIKLIGSFALQLALKAIQMAASWLIAMGPIGWIIAIVVALVALIIANWETVKQWTITAWNAIVGAVKAAWDWIVNLVTTVVQWFIDLHVNAWNAIVTAATTAWNWVVSVVQAAWDWIINLVTTVAQAVVDFVVMCWTAIVDAATTAWQAVSDAIAAAWEWITSTVQGAIDAVVGFIQDCWNKALELVTTAWDNISTAVSDGIRNVIDWVKKLPGMILDGLGNLGNLLLDAGKNLIEGLWNGITGMGGWLKDKILGFVKAFVPGPILSMLGIASPSRYFRDEIGRWIPEGLAVGISQNAQVAGDAALDMAAGAIAGAKAAVSAADFAEIEAYANGAITPGMPVGVTGMVPGSVAALGADPQQQRGGSTININNPLPEQASDTLNRRARTLEALGVLG